MKRFEDTQYLIRECSQFEYLCLYKAHHEKINWEEDCAGIFKEMGRIGTRPITVSFWFVKLNGVRVCFYDGESALVDYNMIHAWVNEQCPQLKGCCDPMNFHNCLDFVRANSV